MESSHQNSLSNVYQFGLQENKSETDAVIFFSEMVCENMDQPRITSALFLDLAKAFNSIFHETFLEKTETCGFSENASNLLNDFLIYYQQCVKLQNQNCDRIPFYHGVAQGTALGPSVFIFYVKDFKNQIIRNMNLK